MPTISSLLRPRLSRLAPATAPAAPARTRRRPEAFDQPRLDDARPSPRRRGLPMPELGLLLLITGVLNLWALSRNGWANEYYSAAVRSMSSSWHNFLYGSFDPSGLMTVDKPPLALWVQALSARVFGFHPLQHPRAAGAHGRGDAWRWSTTSRGAFRRARPASSPGSCSR